MQKLRYKKKLKAHLKVTELGKPGFKHTKFASAVFAFKSKEMVPFQFF